MRLLLALTWAGLVACIDYTWQGPSQGDCSPSEGDTALKDAGQRGSLEACQDLCKDTEGCLAVRYMQDGPLATTCELWTQCSVQPAKQPWAVYWKVAAKPTTHDPKDLPSLGNVQTLQAFVPGPTGPFEPEGPVEAEVLPERTPEAPKSFSEDLKTHLKEVAEIYKNMYGDMFIVPTKVIHPAKIVNETKEEEPMTVEYSPSPSPSPKPKVTPTPTPKPENATTTTTTTTTTTRTTGIYTTKSPLNIRDPAGSGELVSQPGDNSVPAGMSAEKLSQLKGAEQLIAPGATNTSVDKDSPQLGRYVRMKMAGKAIPRRYPVAHLGFNQGLGWKTKPPDAVQNQEGLPLPYRGFSEPVPVDPHNPKMPPTRLHRYTAVSNRKEILNFLSTDGGVETEDPPFEGFTDEDIVKRPPSWMQPHQWKKGTTYLKKST